MPHFKFDPMKELEYLSQRMRRIADDFPETFSFEFGKGFEPRVDVYADKDTLRVLAELPGLRKDAVSLSFADGILTISGNKPVPEHAEGVAVLRAERSFGDFIREIELPKDVDPSSIAATMNDGLLTITLKKKAVSHDSEIKINIS
ncbi:MAG: Hsp20/alpha crystallin family protein [Bacteroidetes bacterium]|nr:Hsp20/alpha crystallin family protein [Bacteroidota bacterium]